MTKNELLNKYKWWWIVFFGDKCCSMGWWTKEYASLY